MTSSSPGFNFQTIDHFSEWKSMVSRQLLLTLFERSKTIDDLLQIRCLLLKTTFDVNPFIVSRFVLSSCSISIHFARRFFDTLRINPPLFAYNTMIRAYASGSSSSAVEAVKLFVQLRKTGLKPDNFTYPFVLKACGMCSVVDHGGAVHSQVLREGLCSDEYIGNTLLRMYGAWGESRTARQVFDEIPERNVASWSSMIATYVACNYPAKALILFHKMMEMWETPNSVTLVSVLSACTSLLKLRFGKCVHSYIVVNGIELDVALGTSLLEMYAKCGEIEKALCLFNLMGPKNLQSWTIMVAALANHGCKEQTLDLIAKMNETGLKPDSMMFSVIFSACSHLGLVDVGHDYFDQMVRVYGIRPTMHHYGCMVDMFGRAGMIREAYDVIKNMPMKPNSVVLRSFIGSCRNHGFSVDEGLEETFFEMEPEVGANYVVAANLFSSSGSHEDAAGLRVAMKEKHVKKVSGRSWVEAN